MRARQNLGLYGYKNEYELLTGYGPDTSGIVWDLGFDGHRLKDQAIIEIWDVDPETMRHSGVYKCQGEYSNTPSGDGAWEYWLGNLALIKRDSEAWGLFDSYSDEIGYEDAPFVIYQCYNEDTGVEFTRLYIDGEFKPSHWIGFHVYLKSTNPIQVIEKIPEEYLPEGYNSGGENGATFIPAVDAEGNLSWSNDKGLDNPESVNIRGPAGQPGQDGYTPIKGTDYFDGEDGRTPVRGEDYWTEADKAEIKAYVDNAILGGAW